MKMKFRVGERVTWKHTGPNRIRNAVGVIVAINDDGTCRIRCGGVTYTPIDPRVLRHVADGQMEQRLQKRMRRILHKHGYRAEGDRPTSTKRWKLHTEK